MTKTSILGTGKVSIIYIFINFETIGQIANLINQIFMQKETAKMNTSFKSDRIHKIVQMRVACSKSLFPICECVFKKKISSQKYMEMGLN